jgi:glycosyltransferase involved in cell wall biosynthesis
MAKYLRRLGERVIVLTTSAYGPHPDDDHDGGGVVRTADLRLLRARLRGHRRIQGIYESDTYSPKRHPLSYLTVPDRMVLAWVPFAVRTALSLHRARRFDAVITTSPPESTHLIGRALAAKGCAWVADLRDGWTFESWRPIPTRLQRQLDERLERRLMQAADVVSCVTRPVAEDLRARMDAHPAVVPHGFDPELIATARKEQGAAAADLLPDPCRVSVVYTGRFYDRDPAPLLRGLRELADEEPAIAEGLELVIAGSLRRQERELLEMDASPLRISVLGALPHRHALALQGAADVLLLICGSERTQVASLKLFEYLAAGRPILGLADGTEAGRILDEAGCEVVPADDPQAIKAAFRRAARGELSGPNPATVQRYAYPGAAKRMADAVDLAIERSTARRRP